MILSRSELETLTEKKHADAQCAALRRLGIPFRLDGRRPVVSRAAVEAMLGARVQTREPQLRA